MNGSERPRPMPPMPPLSPCIQVCVMDADGCYCMGCKRTLEEIAGWWSMCDDEKRTVLAALRLRAARVDR